MPTTKDLRAYSKQLLKVVQELDTLLDRVTTGHDSVEEMKDVASQSQVVLKTLTETHASLGKLAENGLEAKPDHASARISVALSIAELPLEPAVQALRDVPALAEKAAAQEASQAVILVPLSLAYRHCLEALRPLARAVDPRDLIART